MSNRKMSKYVDEQIYTYSDTAKLKHLDNNFKTTGQFNVACQHCQKVVDPMCDFYKPHKYRMSSGYRGPALNAAVHGDEHSDHCINIPLGGAATDNNFDGIDPKTLFNDIFLGRILQPNGRPLKEIIDQCIYEERHTAQGVQRWVHTGHRTNPRHEFMYSLDGKTYHTATAVLK